MGVPFTPGSWEADVRASLLACTTKEEIDAVTAALLKKYISVYQQYSIKVQSHYMKCKLKGMSALQAAKDYDPQSFEKAFEPVEAPWYVRISQSVLDTYSSVGRGVQNFAAEVMPDLLKKYKIYFVFGLIALGLILAITIALAFVF